MKNLVGKWFWTMYYLLKAILSWFYWTDSEMMICVHEASRGCMWDQHRSKGSKEMGRRGVELPWSTIETSAPTEVRRLGLCVLQLTSILM